MPRDVTLLWALRSPCAFACPHCYFGTIEEHKDNLPEQAGVLSHLARTDLAAMTLAAFARTLADSPVERVILAGGEPLDWPATLDIISIIKDAGCQVVIATNGVPLTRPHVTERLVALDVDGVSVSLDSADADTNDRLRPSRSGRFGYHDVLDGISALLRVRGGRATPRVGIYTVVTRSRPQEITDVARLAADLGVDYYVPQPISLAPDHRLFDTLTHTPADVADVGEHLTRLYRAPRGWPYPTRPTCSGSSPRSPPRTAHGCRTVSAAPACSSSSPTARSGTARPTAGSPGPRPDGAAASETATRAPCSPRKRRARTVHCSAGTA
jgi:MoaA/NifB/PqqE/SkfB family radical SAM enzyme